MSKSPTMVTVATAPPQRTSICSGESCQCSIRPHLWGTVAGPRGRRHRRQEPATGKPRTAGSTTVTMTLRPVKARVQTRRNAHEVTIKKNSAEDHVHDLYPAGRCPRARGSGMLGDVNSEPGPLPGRGREIDTRLDAVRARLQALRERDVFGGQRWTTSPRE